MNVVKLSQLNEPAIGSLAERAYQQLVKKITRLELPPNAVLAEKALMAELGIGRTPIREALQRLANEGLVSHFPNRGMLVADISATSVQHIYEFRSIIDGHMAALAATRASKEDIDELAALHDQLVTATDEGDIDRYVALDLRFYEVMARAAQNIYIAEVVPRIFNLHLRLWFFISKKTGSWRAIARSHEDMTRGVVTALTRRQPDEAELAVKIYISRRQQDVRDLL